MDEDGNSTGPPAYTNVDTTASFANLSISSAVYKEVPQPESCIVHLKLLHAIHALKEEVGYTDGLFGLHNSLAADVAREFHQAARHAEGQGPHGEAEMRKLGLSKICEKRWALYVARAVNRYETWWKCLQTPSSGLTEDTMRREDSELYSLFPVPPRFSSVWEMDNLPPLDVLMVLHSHMLNPRAFLEDAMRSSLKWLWQAGMPWHLIHDAIDTDFAYSVPEACRARWTQTTGCSWLNEDGPSTHITNCPRCQVPNHIPWTTCGTNEKGDMQNRVGILVGSGFGDGKLNYKCVACEATICKEALSVRKFVQDTALILTRSAPMPGTILDPQSGMPEAVPSGKPASWFPRTFPNRMIKLFLHDEVQNIFNKHSEPTMETVRDMIEAILKDSSRLCIINGIPYGRKNRRYRLLPKAKFCVRKMLGRYWENFSPFALDLRGAVMRQGVFVEKMVKLDWLHSPSTRETTSRLIKKYFNFMGLMRKYPQNIAVPTLDVDLAWHTHQLNPPGYYSYTVKMTNKFIDHDDKIEETKLNEAFEWTSKTYQEEFHAIYSECTCWYCESIRASHTSSAWFLPGTAKGEKSIDEFYTSGRAKLCPPDNSAHISAHNSVRAVVDGGQTILANFMRSRQEEKLEQNYKKACKRAEKKGRKLPPRDEYYTHWGYTYFMYSPAMYPMYFAPGMYYGWDPCLVHTGSGTSGACAAGSCGGGGVAAGVCGSSGGCGGCGGSSGGGGAGCGGGGGGGGCGGGGGGGGGCGGGGGGC